MRKILTLIAFIAGAAHASEPLSAPVGYEESGSVGEVLYTIENHEQLIAVFGGKASNGKQSIWFTDCPVIKSHGIPELICRTEQDGLIIITTDNNYGILFSTEAENIKNNSIHYKIDSNPIKEVDNVIVPSIPVNFIVLALKGGENITYSYKKKNAYISKTISLWGLKESLDFAQKVLRENK